MSPHFAWKRNESENEQSEIAKKKGSFACFALKQNGNFWMRNEMIRSENTENTENSVPKIPKIRKYFLKNGL